MLGVWGERYPKFYGYARDFSVRNLAGMRLNGPQKAIKPLMMLYVRKLAAPLPAAHLTMK